MDNQQLIYKNRWRQRVMTERRLYFFEHPLRIDGKRITLFQGIKRIENDIVYIAKWSLNILLQMRAFGLIIRKNYKIGLFRQFIQLFYLRFVIRVEPFHYRKRLLFKKESWEFVKQYDYGQVQTQIILAKLSCPGEIGLIEDKFKFFEFCKSQHLSTPRVWAVFRDGRMMHSAENKFSLPDADIFIKNQCYGKGVSAKKFTYSNGRYSDLTGAEYSQNEVFTFLCNESEHVGGIIVQEVITNHPTWKNFTLGGLATCRIVMGKHPETNEVFPLYAALRMPAGNSDADNYSLGGLASSVNLKTGVLGKAVTYKPVRGLFEFDIHPDTNFKIEGSVLPFWNELLDFTQNLHKKVQSLFVGWDVSMTENGCQVIEGNLLWSAGLFENTNQKPFGDTAYPELYEKWMEKLSVSHG